MSNLKFAVGKEPVIENIQEKIITHDLNSKVEIGDPAIKKEEMDSLLKNFWERKSTLFYKFKSRIVKNSITKLAKSEDIEITGLENIKNITGGAIVTMNHFSPIDSLPIRLAAKKIHKRLYTIVQDTNIAMDGPVGTLMNYADTIPVSTGIKYMTTVFPSKVKEVLDNKDWILIYPEQEMWFNYRKPRPLKKGAYHYAVKFNVPIVSCFLETVDLQIEDTEEFNKLKYILHILPPIIYPKQENINIRVAEQELLERDYKQKVAAYEKAYGKKLDYSFEKSFDIAGCRF